MVIYLLIVRTRQIICMVLVFMFVNLFQLVGISILKYLTNLSCVFGCPFLIQLVIFSFFIDHRQVSLVVS